MKKKERKLIDFFFMHVSFLPFLSLALGLLELPPSLLFVPDFVSFPPPCDRLFAASSQLFSCAWDR